MKAVIYENHIAYDSNEQLFVVSSRTNDTMQRQKDFFHCINGDIMNHIESGQCRFNAIRFITLLHTAPRWQR